MLTSVWQSGENLFVDSGIPFKKRAWSDSEHLLRQALEYRHGEEGTRQFPVIALLCKEHPWALVQDAIANDARRVSKDCDASSIE